MFGSATNVAWTERAATSIEVGLPPTLQTQENRTQTIEAAAQGKDKTACERQPQTCPTRGGAASTAVQAGPAARCIRKCTAKVSWENQVATLN